MGRAREIADLIGGTTPDIILKTSDGAILNLQTSDTTVTADSVLGAINFQAPDEADGTDSILVASKMTLSSGGVLDVDGGITVDNITIDGTEIDLSSGDLTIDVEGDITLDANGQQIFFAKGGTTFGQFGTESTPSTFTIESTVSDGDINFKGNDGGSGITAMTIDMSAGGREGIGTTSPATILDVDGGANSDQATFSGTAGRGLKISTFSVGAADEGVDFDAQASGTTQALTFSTGGTERVRVDGSGNLFIGKTSSASGTVGFEYNNAGQLAVTRSGDTVALFNRTSDNGNIIDLRKDNTLIGEIGSDNGVCFIQSAGGGNLAGIGFSRTAVAVEPRKNDAFSDNEVDVGSSTNRFDDVHATNGTIQTSDQNDKQDIASATTKELNVAKKLSALFKTFRWKDKVAEKGDKARTHSGIIAQEIQSAFSAEGLDASDYGLFISNTWWEKEISVDAVKADEEKGIEAKDAYTYRDTKKEKTDGYTERTRLGVRYPELFSFIFSSIEARLTALESK